MLWTKTTVFAIRSPLIFKMAPQNSILSCSATSFPLPALIPALIPALTLASLPVSVVPRPSTMGQNQVILRHQKFTFPRVSGASERANGRASGPVLTSRFLFVPDHSATPIGFGRTPSGTYYSPHRVASPTASSALDGMSPSSSRNGSYRYCE